MWTVIYIAPNRSAGERMQEMLTREGLLVKLRAVRMRRGEEPGPFEVMVPHTEAAEAHEVLVEALGREQYPQR